MQLVFTPALGSSTTLAVQPGSVVQFAARVSTRDYNEAVASGTRVELWGDLPNAGEWTATRFEPAPAAPEHFDEGIPSNVLSLLPADPEPVPTTSAAPETTLLVASFVIPAHIETADYQFTYRLAHSNESSTWHTWLGDAGSNGHLIINQQAPPVEGLVFNDEKTAATLAGPVDWSGWALDLDSTVESPATPRRFSALPKALSATHIALFPNPGLTTLNPASHVPVLLSSTAPLSLDDRNLTAHGAPINVAPLSRAAVESSLPDHAVLLAESATTPPFVIIHDTRGAVLSILPAGTTSPGTQIISLDLDQAKVAADAPAKSLLFSPSANKAAFYTPGTRVAVPVLGADVLVQETYALGDKGAWEVGVAGGAKVNEPEPEPEVAQPVVQSVPEPTKLAPPPIQTTRPTVPELDTPVSPETPADARFGTPPSKQPELETVSESEEHESEPQRSLSPRPHSSTASLTPAEHKKGVLAILQGVAAVVMCYVSRAWRMFGLGFRMFGIGVRVPTAKAEETPAVVVTPAEAPAAPTQADIAPTQKAPAPATDESESDSETGSLNEVAPTPIDPKHTIPVAVVDPATHSTPRRPNVDMPLTPPMSPKAATSHVPFVIPTEPKPAPKPKLTFTSPEKSTLFVVGPSTDELEVKIGGVRIPTSWDRVDGPGEASTWVLEVEVGKGQVEVAVV